MSNRVKAVHTEVASQSVYSEPTQPKPVTARELAHITNTSRATGNGFKRRIDTERIGPTLPQKLGWFVKGGRRRRSRRNKSVRSKTRSMRK
jgi:hypothetical protein